MPWVLSDDKNMSFFEQVFYSLLRPLQKQTKNGTDEGEAIEEILN